jgi:hypothetical protein
MTLLQNQPANLSKSDGHIVFVHVGTDRPRLCLSEAADQAFEQDPAALIWIFTERGFEPRIRERMHHGGEARVRFVFTDEIPVLPLHEAFRQTRKIPPGSRDFLQVTSERFYYLYDLLCHFGLRVVVYLESDVMIYAPLTSLINTRRGSASILYPLDKLRGNTSVLYLHDEKACELLCRHCIDHPAPNDMDLLEQFYQAKERTEVASLPTIPEDVCITYGLDYQRYTRPKLEGWGIFDATAIGQYLLGTDPRFDTISSLRFINASSALAETFNENIISICEDYFVLNTINGQEKINNVHVDSKKTRNLKRIKFKSFPNGLEKLYTKNQLIEDSELYIYHSGLGQEPSQRRKSFRDVDLNEFHQNGTTRISPQLFQILDSCSSIYIERGLLKFFADLIVPHLDSYLCITVGETSKQTKDSLRSIYAHSNRHKIYAPVIDEGNKILKPIGCPDTVQEYVNLIGQPFNPGIDGRKKYASLFFPVAHRKINTSNDSANRIAYYQKLSNSYFAVVPSDISEELLIAVLTECSICKTILTTSDSSSESSRFMMNLKAINAIQTDVVSYLNTDSAWI